MNDWRWAATLNEGEIDTLWKEVEEKGMLRGKPNGFVQGAKVIERFPKEDE